MRYLVVLYIALMLSQALTSVVIDSAKWDNDFVPIDHWPTTKPPTKTPPPTQPPTTQPPTPAPTTQTPVKTPTTPPPTLPPTPPPTTLPPTTQPPTTPPAPKLNTQCGLIVPGPDPLNPIMCDCFRNIFKYQVRIFNTFALICYHSFSQPWFLTPIDAAQGICDQRNTKQSAFVEVTVYEPVTNQLSVYHPLVLNLGDTLAVRPVAPTLSPGAVVGIWVSSNIYMLGGSLSLLPDQPPAAGFSLKNGNCVHGSGDMPTNAAPGAKVRASVCFCESTQSHPSFHQYRGKCDIISFTYGAAVSQSDWILLGEWTDILSSYHAQDRFGQYAFCNAEAFFAAVNKAIVINGNVNPPLPPAFPQVGIFASFCSRCIPAFEM